MNNKEFIGKMQMVYFGEKNALEECTQAYLKLNLIKNEYESRMNKVINYIQETCFINEDDKTEVCEYGDDLNPRHIIKLLKGE